MILRKEYLEYIKPFINKPVIKVISGIRRSGKSSIMKMIKSELLKNGIAQENILYINFENFDFADINTAKTLYEYIKNYTANEGKYYLLLDEIQEVEGWEKVINSFLAEGFDIYITGSNSRMLSSELSTYLAGRFIEIPVYTLSFTEAQNFAEAYNPSLLKENRYPFDHYLHNGGFPVLHTANYTEESAYRLVYDIYSSVILRDTVQRYAIRDVELLERVVKFAINNIGNTFSGKNVADFFKSQQRKIDINTVYNYLNALEGAFILHRVSRFDIKGKEILKTQEKFYLGDIALLYATMGFRPDFISGILENMVFLELKRRRYNVFIGKIGEKEIDFIATKENQKIYIQVAYKLDSPTTVEREFSALQQIDDNYPKFVITMDDIWKGNVEGIQHLHITEFLTSNFLTI